MQHLQAISLGLGGRGGDTEIAHVTPGEWIIPEHMLTPDLIADLHRAAKAQGIDPATLQVGSGDNSINPNTGRMEFRFMNWENWLPSPTELRGKLQGYAGKLQSYAAAPFEEQKPAATILPPTGAPSEPPSDKDLQYDPNGPGLLRAAGNDPLGAASALWHGGRAWQETKDRYEGGPAASSLHNGEGDAWRHARWNQRMTNSIGPERAKNFADLNERWNGAANPADERIMDLYNNQVGQSLLGDNSKLTIDELLRSGRLRMRPY